MSNENFPPTNFLEQFGRKANIQEPAKQLLFELKQFSNSFFLLWLSFPFLFGFVFSFGFSFNLFFISCVNPEIRIEWVEVQSSHLPALFLDFTEKQKYNYQIST